MRLDQLIRFAIAVGVIARPAVIMRMPHPARPHRVEFDVAVTRQKIRLALGETRAEASFPQGAAARVCAVDVLPIALTEVLHHQGGAVGFFWRQQQVDMMGHQHLSVNRAAEARGELSQFVEIAVVIFFCLETNRAVIATLDDMPGDAGQAQPGAAWHGAGE